MSRKRVLNLLKLGVAVGVLYYLVFTGKLDFSQIPNAFRYFHWIVLVLVMLIAQIALATWRWKLLLQGVGVKESWWNLLNFSWIGQLFNNVMLGSVGGDVIKIFYVVRHFPTKKAVTGMTVLLDRAIGLYCMLLFVYFGLMIAPQEVLAIEAIQGLRAALGALLLVSFIVGPLMFSKRIRKKIPLKGVFAELADAIQNYRNCKH